jgi:SAM-dependent methyltransferase
MNPPPDFDRLARIYRWLEYLSFGPFLWRCRIHFLPQLLQSRRALVLGDGDGRFTARLLAANPRIRITAIDASPRMIASLRRAAAPNDDRLTTEVADIRAWKPDNSTQFDLIATHFFLDCLSTEEIASLAQRLSPNLAPEALWLISEFAIPPSLVGRAIATPLVAALYRVFGQLTGLRQQSLPEHSVALGATGWTLRIERDHLQGILLSQLWEHEPPRL